MKVRLLSAVLLFLSSSVFAQEMDRTNYLSMRVDTMAVLRTAQNRAEALSKSPNQSCRHIGTEWEYSVFAATEALGQLTAAETQGAQFPGVYDLAKRSMKGWEAMAQAYRC